MFSGLDPIGVSHWMSRGQCHDELAIGQCFAFAISIS